MRKSIQTGVSMLYINFKRLEQKKEHLDSYTRKRNYRKDLFEETKEQKKEHYYRRRTRIAMPFLIITMITSRAVRSYHHVSRISYSGASVKGLN